MAISTKIARIHQRGESWHTPNFGKNGEYGINGLARCSNKTYDKNHHIADFTKITNLARSYKKNWQKLEQDDKNGKKGLAKMTKKQPDKPGISIMKNNLRLENLAWIHQRSAKKIKSVNDFDKNVNLTKLGTGQESQNDEFCEIGEFVANFWSKVWEDGLLITSRFQERGNLGENGEVTKNLSKLWQK